jgi:hypothetical protein
METTTADITGSRVLEIAEWRRGVRTGTRHVTLVSYEFAVDARRFKGEAVDGVMPLTVYYDRRHPERNTTVYPSGSGAPVVTLTLVVLYLLQVWPKAKPDDVA